MPDVIVIGAGLSGLVAAHRLRAAGASVRVLEARDRVGGRTLSVPLGDAIVDLGGAWMSAAQPRLAALAAELGVATMPVSRAGRAVVATSGRRLRLPGAGLWTALALGRRMRAIERLAATVPATDPAGAARAAEWDARSAGEFLAGQGGVEVTGWLRLAAELELAAPPEEVSLLSFLASVRGCGGFGSRADAGGEHRFTGGAQELARRLAAGLGDAVTLGAPVRAIEQDARGIVVDGQRAAHGVLAVPPALAARMAWTPALPPGAARFASDAAAGPVVKVAVAYARPFWRDDGLSGEAYQSEGWVRAVVDVSQGEQGVLLCFLVGDAARAWTSLPPADRRGRLLVELAELFGEPASAPLGTIDMDWGADPFSRGCVANLPTGSLTSGARWGGAHGRIQLAGTEASAAWPRHLEGAVQAGEHAAAALIATEFPPGR